MGEILRAICEASCLYSAPAFYVGRISQPTTTAARALSERRGVFQLKADTWFLCMAWSQDTAIGTPQMAEAWEGKNAATTYLLQDMKTSRTFGNLPIQKQNAGYNLNNIVCLPHYILFEPSTLIGIIESVPTTNPAGATSVDAFVTLVGIEYQMPASMR